MDTVADTLTIEDYIKYERLFNLQDTDDLFHYAAEAKRKQDSCMEYYAQPDLFDYFREDTAMMESFFNWLDLASLNLEKIKKVCIDFLVNSNCETQEKEHLGNDLNNLISFNESFISYGRFISEKGFYYAGLLDKLDEMQERANSEKE